MGQLPIFYGLALAPPDGGAIVFIGFVCDCVRLCAIVCDCVQLCAIVCSWGLRTAAKCCIFALDSFCLT